VYKILLVKEKIITLQGETCLILSKLASLSFLFLVAESVLNWALNEIKPKQTKLRHKGD
jgi:hypothetical protein